MAGNQAGDVELNLEAAWADKIELVPGETLKLEIVREAVHEWKRERLRTAD